mmetsp:Transcript_25330/g.52964  ORF Transcript_25330/g.52964 Transcript_25330/m.52964 type:complete len:739 (+) Transcript_25330:150-2366(+)
MMPVFNRRAPMLTVIAALLLFMLDESTAINNFFDKSSSQPKLDPYKVLGVKRTATDEAIQKAYRQKAKETHPDKNPSPHANDEFRRVSDAFELLSNPTDRRKYDAQMQRDAQRRRKQHEQERQREQKRRNQMHREQKEREKKHKAMLEKARGSQSRIMRFSTMEQFESSMLSSTKNSKVYETHCLIMFVSNKNAEKMGDEEYYFPYPFAGEGGAGRNNLYEGMLRVAKVRFNAQTDLTRLFRAKSRNNVPHIVFAKKGDAVGKFQIFRHGNSRRDTSSKDAHGEFKQWVESLLLIEATVVNFHSVAVDYLIVRNGHIILHESLQPYHEHVLSLHAQDRILAFDQRLDSYPGGEKKNHAHLLATNAKGALLLDTSVTSDGVYSIEKKRCYDLSTQCHGWTVTSRGINTGQCAGNSEFMHNVCPSTCGVCSEHFGSDLVYFAMHYPIYRLPSFLQNVVRSGRHFVGDIRNILKLRKNAAVAFFVVGLLVPFNIFLFQSGVTRASSSRLKHTDKGQTSSLILLLDLVLLILTATIWGGTAWMISNSVRAMPLWLRGFHRDLVGVARYPDIFMLLLIIGVITFAYIKGLQSSMKNGKLAREEQLFFITALVALVASILTALSFNISSDAMQAIRWQNLWRYHKNAAFFVFVVGIVGAAAFVSLQRLSKPLRKISVSPAILMNLVVLSAIGVLASNIPHFQVDLMHVLKLRKNAAFSFVVAGVLSGQVLIEFLFVEKVNPMAA